MKNPLVTVLTPTFNHGSYIGACLESVRRQAYGNWEQIVLDDCSDDRTAAIARWHAERDDRIHVVTASTRRGISGLHQTYNVGLSLARGDLIAVLEGDDMWPADRLRMQVPLFGDPEVTLAFGHASVVGSDGTVRGRVRGVPGDASRLRNRPVGAILRPLLLRNFISPSTVLVRRERLVEIEGFRQPDYFPAADYPTWLHLALTGEFRFVNKTMGYWRVHASQATVGQVVDQARAVARFAREFFEDLPAELKRVTGLDAGQLEAAGRAMMAGAHIHAGRFRLQMGDRATASRHFLRALAVGDVPTRAKALAALGCAVTGLNLERAAAMAGRNSYSLR